jgi:hypothetical protein
MGSEYQAQIKGGKVEDRKEIVYLRKRMDREVGKNGMEE